MNRRAVFLDRDGTIIRDLGYLSDQSRIELEKGAAEGLRAMVSLGLELIVVSNQSGVSRGLFTTDDVVAVNQHLAQLLLDQDVPVCAWYFCPHAADDGCRCRKPAPGMLESAAVEYGICLTDSFVVGDKISDLKLGDAAGAKSILVQTGEGSKFAATAESEGYAVCENLREASCLIGTWLDRDANEKPSS